MQQSLKILQMDSIALKDYIRAELEKNPMLEEISVSEESPFTSCSLDVYWDDSTDAEPFSSDSADHSGRAPDPSGWRASSSYSLCDHLLEQLSLTNVPRELFSLSRYLILSLDDNGWLTESPETISTEQRVPLGKVRAALKIIQNMDPAGVGAADYRESLLLQARRLSLSPEARRILESDTCLAFLADHKIARIADFLDIDLDQAIKAAESILTLNPKPGATFGGADTLYVIPDAYVSLSDFECSVSVGNPSIPEIRINSQYSHILDESSDPEVSRYLNECLRQAQSLIRGISQRNQTFFLVISEIVRRQQDYFKSSTGYLLPMTLGDVAGELGLSISTVSRAVKNKHISCCRSVVPISSLFTSKACKSIAPDTAASSQEIQELIRRLINEEDKASPLSDPRIARILSDSGYSIARRTVAKYRTQMGIPAAEQRRSL